MGQFELKHALSVPKNMERRGRYKTMSPLCACLCSGRALLGGQLFVSLTDEINLLSIFCAE
jgi:hypothetical protein